LDFAPPPWRSSLCRHRDSSGLAPELWLACQIQEGGDWAICVSGGKKGGSQNGGVTRHQFH